MIFEIQTFLLNKYIEYFYKNTKNNYKKKGKKINFKLNAKLVIIDKIINS